MGGGAQVGSKAGHHVYGKLKLPETETIVELREPHRHHPKISQIDQHTMHSPLKAGRQKLALKHDPTMDMVTRKCQWAEFKSITSHPKVTHLKDEMFLIAMLGELRLGTL